MKTIVITITTVLVVQSVMFLSWSLYQGRNDSFPTVLDTPDVIAVCLSGKHRIDVEASVFDCFKYGSRLANINSAFKKAAILTPILKEGFQELKEKREHLERLANGGDGD